MPRQCSAPQGKVMHSSSFHSRHSSVDSVMATQFSFESIKRAIGKQSSIVFKSTFRKQLLRKSIIKWYISESPRMCHYTKCSVWWRKSENTGQRWSRITQWHKWPWMTSLSTSLRHKMTIHSLHSTMTRSSSWSYHRWKIIHRVRHCFLSSPPECVI